MKKSICRAFAAALCALLLLPNAVPAMASGNYVAETQVTYGQTEARAMLDRINAFRQSDEAWYWNKTDTEKIYVTGLQPLQYDYDLENTAMLRALEIALYFSHTRPDGAECFSAFSDREWSALGENIACGQLTEEIAFTDWREDDDPYAGQGHRRNMLSEDFEAVGIGHAVVNGMHCWVQEFRAPCASNPKTPALDGKRPCASRFRTRS